MQVDGRTVYNPLSSGVYWDTVDYPLEDIDRIEVIRGPGASVWGANAVNGVINIITKPAKETQGGSISGGSGTEERGFGSFRYGGDLLAFSRMGRVEIAESRVHLDGLVQDTIRSLEMATNGRNIVWEAALLPQVIGDRSMLKQVFGNLVGNAVKYSRMRNPAQIEIGCAGEENGRIILFVRDNGAGFDMRYVHKLFGVFQRLHRAEEFEGTGIGLATVRRIVGRHGGRVWAEGAVNQGASFYFTLQRSPSA